LLEREREAITYYTVSKENERGKLRRVPSSQSKAHNPILKTTSAFIRKKEIASSQQWLEMFPCVNT